MIKRCAKCQNVEVECEDFRIRKYCIVTRLAIYPNTQALCSYYKEKTKAQLEIEDYEGW